MIINFKIHKKTIIKTPFNSQNPFSFNIQNPPSNSASVLSR